jgi:hypothetical protein
MCAGLWPACRRCSGPVVYFTYWEDLPERAVAEMLQLSPGTVHVADSTDFQSQYGSIVDCD